MITATIFVGKVKAETFRYVVPSLSECNPTQPYPTLPLLNVLTPSNVLSQVHLRKFAGTMLKRNALSRGLSLDAHQRRVHKRQYLKLKLIMCHRQKAARACERARRR